MASDDTRPTRERLLLARRFIDERYGEAFGGAVMPPVPVSTHDHNVAA